jgi:hypothetical protein
MYKFILIFSLLPFILFAQIGQKNDQKFIVHTITLQDSFYTLKSKYNITRRDLILHNPFLKGSIYLYDFQGQDILIPIKKNYYELSNKLKIGLLLPFHTDLIDSLTMTNNNLTLDDIDYRSFKSIDFYTGFLFSVNEYIEKGNQVDLFVFDTYNNVDSVHKILDNELKEMDLIVGPLYQSNFNLVKDFFYGTKTIVVSPFIKNINSNYYTDNFFFMECDEMKQLEYLSKYIFDNFSDHNISIFSRNDTTTFKDDYFRNAISLHLDSIKTVKNIMTMSPTIDSIHHELDTIDFKNVILVPSKEKDFVIDLISKLHAFKRDTSMVVFCMDYINKFKQIPTYELNNLNVHFVSNKDFAYDYKRFITSYHSVFETDARDKYLLKGYESGKYFLELLLNDPNLIDKEVSILGTRYNFSLQESNMYRNEGYDVWYYEDFEIKKINRFD